MIDLSNPFTSGAPDGTAMDSTIAFCGSTPTRRASTASVSTQPRPAVCRHRQRPRPLGGVRRVLRSRGRPDGPRAAPSVWDRACAPRQGKEGAAAGDCRRPAKCLDDVHHAAAVDRDPRARQRGLPVEERSPEGVQRQLPARAERPRLRGVLPRRRLPVGDRHARSPS